ncbi:MAG: mechanosensitive ion channel domain-containing protein [Candidatus Neomarinimicrobiota bacterium]|nr:mechanosensitive ion channel domain-containing protein [Candidatus Neomarinimicrobiota bacterium]
MINNLMQYLPQDPFIHSLTIIAILLFASLLGYGITVRIIIRLITKMFSRTATKLDDILIKRNVFNRLAYLVPALILYNFAHVAPEFTGIIQKISMSLMVVSGMLVINSFLSALTDIYQKTKFSERLNIKSYVQISKLIINVLGCIIIIAFLLEKDPTLLISGLGAMTAVLMLIFKDTILSLVASLQISSNDLFKVGDWIEAPQFGADGDVIDIALHTVKIQNWDKTISIIPTHKLIDSTFKNWRGMSQSGGRRIKRSLFLDMNSISACTPEELEKYKKIELIKDYVESKQIDVKKYNEENNIDTSNIINGRQLTNIGTFRAYVEAYLKNNSNIHDNMTFLVRQLEPTDKGLPLQIYVFSNDTNWVNYEGIQSDIFDHLIAMANEFGLKIFQNPTGQDFNKLV